MERQAFVCGRHSVTVPGARPILWNVAPASLSMKCDQLRHMARLNLVTPPPPSLCRLPQHDPAEGQGLLSKRSGSTVEGGIREDTLKRGEKVERGISYELPESRSRLFAGIIK